MNLPPAPSSLPSNLQLIWTQACLSGYNCAFYDKGYQEQNPYLLHEPLFEAWREGWFAGIYDTPIKDLVEFKAPKHLQHILLQAHRKLIKESAGFNN